MILSIRPIVTWPGELRSDRQRIRSPFNSSYSDTLELLDRELRMIRATVTVVQLAVNEGQIRRDGKLRANQHPDHPGVVLSFQTARGSFRYAADRFTHWHDNLRGIALGLEALRKFERYGIGSGTEQFTGFLQLEGGNGADAPMTREDAARFIAKHGAYDPDAVLIHWPYQGIYYRTCARKLHPDSPSGDAELFKRLQEAKRILDAGIQ